MKPGDLGVIQHCRKSVLIHNGKPLIKKSRDNGFDIPQGSLDGAEISELMGIFILYKINKLVHIDDYGLYRDNRLVVVSANRRVNKQY